MSQGSRKAEPMGGRETDTETPGRRLIVGNASWWRRRGRAPAVWELEDQESPQAKSESKAPGTGRLGDTGEAMEGGLSTSSAQAQEKMQACSSGESRFASSSYYSSRVPTGGVVPTCAAEGDRLWLQIPTLPSSTSTLTDTHRNNALRPYCAAWGVISNLLG